MKGVLRRELSADIEGEGNSAGLKFKDIAPRLFLVGLVLFALVWLLSQKLVGIDLQEVRISISEIPAHILLICVVLTCISFTAISLYDVIGIRVFNHALPPSYVAKSGFTATAIGQTTGFGLLFGTGIRWRFYRHYGISPAGSAAVTLFVSISFMIASSLMLAVSGLFAPVELGEVIGVDAASIKSLALLGTGISLVLLVVFYLQPRISFRGNRVQLPKFKAVTNMALLSALDVVPAAAILWLLLPADAAPSFFTLLPIYLATMTIGLLSNAPGGIGVLELACIVALPDIPQTELLAALIVYRGIFYGLPFLVATAFFAEHEWKTGPYRRVKPNEERRKENRLPTVLTAHAAGNLPPEIQRVLKKGRRAEAELAWLGDKSFLMAPDRSAAIMFAGAGNGLVALSDPIGSQECWPALTKRFQALARSEMVSPVYYKIGSKFASLLASQDWIISKIGTEAIVDLRGFDLQVPERRELRRKWNKISKTGMKFVHHQAGRAPLARFQPISDQWLQSKKKERGFSLGRFDRAYMAGFDIVEAVLGDRSLGFVSLWKSGDGNEWSIDVMRVANDAPNGTMHGLIIEAIAAAKRADVGQLSLCSVPFAGIEQPSNLIEWVTAALYKYRGAKQGLDGLYRFKNSFRPEWQPVYMATRGSSFPVSAVLAIHRLVEGKA